MVNRIKDIFVFVIITGLLIIPVVSGEDPADLEVVLAADGGDLTQTAYNAVATTGGLVATVSMISMQGAAPGTVDQSALNSVAVTGDDQEVIMEIEMTAIAGGDISQDATNTAAIAGDDVDLSQSISMSADSAEGTVTQNAENYAVFEGNQAFIEQYISMSGIGSQVFQNPDSQGNVLFYTGDEGIISQYFEAAASGLDLVEQYLQNFVDSTGDDSVIGQSIIASAVSGNGPLYQVGMNVANGDDGMDLGQAIWLAGSSPDVLQESENGARFQNDATISQWIALSGMSTENDVTQYAYNSAIGTDDLGDSTSFVAQGISGAAWGRPTATQLFSNYLATSQDPDESLMAAQSIAATINAEQYAGQELSNYMDWWSGVDGQLGQEILASSFADLISQYSGNYLNPFP